LRTRAAITALAVIAVVIVVAILIGGEDRATGAGSDPQTLEPG